MKIKISFKKFIDIINKLDVLGSMEVEDRSEVEHIIFEYIKDCDNIVIGNSNGCDLTINFKQIDCDLKHYNI